MTPGQRYLKTFYVVMLGLLVMMETTTGDSERRSECQKVQSKFHDDAHCICADGQRCIGSACSVGHNINGDEYSNKVFGYRADCVDCSCVVQDQPHDFAAIRARKELWIIGTHHKTGSFLNERIWGHLRQLVDPHLNIRINSFNPMTKEKWQQLNPQCDVVVTFHATGINESLVNVFDRPYKFVHVVRDPVKQIVSALLYEIQREGTGVHDSYFKTVRAHKDNLNEALKAIGSFMIPDLVAMEEQFKEAEKDHNAINLRLEDFTADFDNTIERMFRFLGVPNALMPKFIRQAQKEDLSRQNETKVKGSVHITAFGKYDKSPLEFQLLHDHNFSPTLRRIRTSLHYS